MNQITPTKRDAKTRLLDAALEIVRMQGYADTSVDDLCKRAGVTKGAFFHHFKSKDDLGIAAARHWGAVTGALFAGAPYHQHADPLDRVLAYLDFRRDLLAGEVADFTCFVGTILQEAYATHPEVRAACMACIEDHSATLTPYIEEAMRRHRPLGDWTPHGLALHFQAVLQGAFILAKGTQDARIAADSIDHLKRYVEFLFARPPSSSAS